jgi:hypothetical protein
MKLFQFLRRRLDRWYGPVGSAHAFIPSQDNLALCVGCGRTLQAGDHDRRGDTTRPYGFGGGGGGGF